MVDVAPQRIVIPEARLAFPDLFEARVVEQGGKPKFGATFIIPPGAPVLAQLLAEEERVAREKWQDKAPTILAMIRANNRAAVKPGILKAKFDGFEGNYFIACNMDNRPTVVSRTGSPVTAKDGIIYAGCYVLGHVSLWAQDNQFGQRINAECTGVQFVKDGDAFSAGAPPSSVEDFGNLDAGGAPQDMGGGDFDPMS